MCHRLVARRVERIVIPLVMVELKKCPFTVIDCCWKLVRTEL